MASSEWTLYFVLIMLHYSPQTFYYPSLPMCNNKTNVIYIGRDTIHPHTQTSCRQLFVFSSGGTMWFPVFDLGFGIFGSLAMLKKQNTDFINYRRHFAVHGSLVHLSLDYYIVTQVAALSVCTIRISSMCLIQSLNNNPSLLQFETYFRKFDSRW